MNNNVQMNLFWPVYKNIENEIVKLTFNIQFTDEQLGVFSSKITDLILRIVAEIESLSKKLYRENGGDKNGNFKFDDVALEHLNKLWLLDKKLVIINSYNCFFSEQERIIFPFEKNTEKENHKNKKKNTYRWNDAYQNLKHDRVENYRKGNIGNLLHAAAALYLLNIYYVSKDYSVGNIMDIYKFDTSLGSSLFSIKYHMPSIVNYIDYPKKSDFNECVYYMIHTEDSCNLLNKFNEQFKKELEIEYSRRIPKNNKSNPLDFKEIENIEKEVIKETNNKFLNKLIFSTKQIYFNALLNKNDI